MPLVELVGPPAVGKTTLVAACRGQGLQDARLAVLEPRHPALAPLARRAAHAPSALRWIGERLLRRPGHARTEVALAEVASAWGPFLDLVLDGPGTTPDPSPAQRALAVMERAWLLEAIRLRALLATSGTTANGQAVLLLDEGLTHPYKLFAAAGGDPERIARYATLVPLPDVLVVLDAKTALVADRIRMRHARERGRARWASLGEHVDDRTLHEEIERVRRAVDAVESAARDRGCTVLRLDVSTEPVRATASRLRRALAGVERRSRSGGAA